MAQWAFFVLGKCGVFGEQPHLSVVQHPSHHLVLIPSTSTTAALQIYFLIRFIVGLLPDVLPVEDRCSCVVIGCRTDSYLPGLSYPKELAEWSITLGQVRVRLVFGVGCRTLPATAWRLAHAGFVRSCRHHSLLIPTLLAIREGLVRFNTGSDTPQSHVVRYAFTCPSDKSVSFLSRESADKPLQIYATPSTERT